MTNTNLDPILLTDSATATKPNVRQAWLRVVLFLLTYLSFTFVVQALAFAVSMAVMDKSAEDLQFALSDNPYWLGLFQLLSLGVTLMVVGLFRRGVDRKSVSSLGWSLQNRQSDSLNGLVLGWLLISAGFVTLWLLGNLKVINLQIQPLSLLYYFLLCAVIAINEELMVRGYILNNLLESYNKYVSLAISAFIFTLLHAINPNISVVALLNIFLAGILLGVYYIHEKNLWFPIFLHLSWNYFQGPIYGFEVSGINLKGVVQQEVIGHDLLTGGDFGFEGSLLLTVLMIGAIAGVHLKYGRKELIA